MRTFVKKLLIIDTGKYVQANKSSLGGKEIEQRENSFGKGKKPFHTPLSYEEVSEGRR